MIIQVFLGKRELLTIKYEVCKSEGAVKFLRSLGVNEADPVDDIIRNVLPKYQSNEIKFDMIEYNQDIHRILKAFNPDSSAKNKKLIDALKKSKFIIAFDAGSKSKLMTEPDKLYFSTNKKLMDLFDGVDGVLFVDDNVSIKGRSEDVRNLLEACGVARYLQPVEFISSFAWNELQKMRIDAGCKGCSWGESIKDWKLRGFDELFKQISLAKSDFASKKAALIWLALEDMENQRGKSVFSGLYEWHYNKWHNTKFDSAFIRQLNEVSWIPDENGNLKKPKEVFFDDIGWSNHPFLESKIIFKPRIIDQLARAVGIDVEVLDLLKETGLTNIAQLKAKLNIIQKPVNVESNTHEDDKWMPIRDAKDVVLNVTSFVSSSNEPNLGGQNVSGGNEVKYPERKTESDLLSKENMLTNSTNSKSIGDWGEGYALGYLKELFYDKNVVDLNAGGNIGKGYDIVIRDGNNDIAYYEVKSKVNEHPELFEISGTQWSWAYELYEKNKGDKYIILLVSNAGKENAKITVITNPVKLWKEGKLWADPINIKL